MSRVNRIALRRTVCAELRNVRSYRRALRDGERTDRHEHMRAWVRVADDMLDCMRDDGEDRARFIDALYGITRRPFGSSRYVFTIFGDRLHMSVAGLERWRENAVFTASILAIQYGAIDLSREP